MSLKKYSMNKDIIDSKADLFATPIQGFTILKNVLREGEPEQLQ